MAEHHPFDYTSISSPYKQFCIRGGGIRNLKNARGLSIEPVSGLIYVVERGNSRIQVFSPEGEHKFFLYPRRPHADMWGICINKGLIYVTDYHKGVVYVFTLTGEVVSEFGKGFDRNGRIINMMQPMGLSVDRNGDIYVCEFGAKQIIILEESFLTNHIHTVAHSSPHSIFFNEDGSKTCLIAGGVVSYGKETLSLETQRLSYKSIGTPRGCSWFGDFDRDGNIILSDMRGFKIMIFKTSSGSPRLIHYIKMTQLGCPMGIAVDRNGKIVCATNSKVYFFQRLII